ncbi:distal membrane-arm assembly complex protein 2 [Centruroides vittatus]|uniref:distal membrane-arm assembly complex protein 2 n=1 Tax=Centruroides vittatus TaxID=120091 RepID=UPI0035107013
MFRFILNKTDALFCRGITMYLLQNKPFQIAVLNHRCYSDDKTSSKKYDERENSILYTVTSVFSLSVDSLSFLHQLPNLNMTKIKEWRRKHLRKKEIEDQIFIPERFQILGSDLAAAHFIVHRGGSVRFKDQENWIRKDKNGNYFLPPKFVSNLYLEEIDASGTGLIYEGFSNLEYLYYLKSLNLSGCPKIDDWCLSRLHMFKSTLEHLDISNCPNITERGISSLYILRNLKTLNLSNLSNVDNLHFVCLLLEDILPNCHILGVKDLEYNQDNDHKLLTDNK